MDYLEIVGGSKLSGEVKISGAKNAALPLLALSILAKNEYKLRNVPSVQDIKTFITLLKNIGSVTSFENNNVLLDTSIINSTKATYDIVKKMRASILVLGPLLARFGHCEVSLPGGCAIGQRPIDLHIKALEKMGAKIELKQGYVVAKAPNGLHGANIIFDKITVGGTENILMAASLANGITKITNAAKEPEVTQLATELNNAGVKIEGIGTSELTIHGTNGELINFPTIQVIPDRIEAGTYLCAAAMTKSSITLTNVNKEHLLSNINKLKEMGFGFEMGENWITILENNNIKPTKIQTQEYPGFPTDMQAQFMALCTMANGASIIEERLFENRFMHVSELQRLGANISLNGNTATIIGPSKLTGTDVMATDLRASSALILTALVANGTTKIHRIYHLDRGYENLEEKLKNLGANVVRLSE
jgi:UDP-N-acetylglucosamine 1-carboxyvinyltransferase